MQRGNALANAFRSSEAAALYRQVLAQAPDHVDALVGLAAALTRKPFVKNVAEAAECLRRALQLQPQSGLITYNLAAVYDLAGKREESLAGFRRAIRLRPDFLPARQRLSVLREQVCDWHHRGQEHQAYVACLMDHLNRGAPIPIDPWSLLTLPLSPEQILRLAEAYSNEEQAPARPATLAAATCVT